MTSDDTTDPQTFDIRAGLGLLTRLPVTVNGPRATARGAAAAWAWPVAGAIVGVFGAAAAWGALALGLTPGIAAAVALGAQMMITGALHEDGLADSADGLWGGWDKARRLAIMKDSHIGTYGVLALLIVSLIRWTAADHASVQRRDLVASDRRRCAQPRTDGGGDGGVAQCPRRGSVAKRGTATRAPPPQMASPWRWSSPCSRWRSSALSLCLPVAATTLALALVAKRRIGGQTGDILGATQQLAEAAILATLAAGLA